MKVLLTAGVLIVGVVGGVEAQYDSVDVVRSAGGRALSAATDMAASVPDVEVARSARAPAVAGGAPGISPQQRECQALVTQGATAAGRTVTQDQLHDICGRPAAGANAAR